MMERDLVARVTSEGFSAWRGAVRRTGGCRRPVRLRGSASAVDPATGVVAASWGSADAPDGVLLVACGDRRRVLCPPCAARYQADQWHSLHAGLVGRTSSPEVSSSVRAHPRLLVTLTAPSFGAVHRGGGCVGPRGDRTCAHGRAVGCVLDHTDTDPAVGQPLCPECWDYTGAVLWNASVGELWRRTRIGIDRALAPAVSRTVGHRVGVRTVRDFVRVSYTKVAEFQRRGLVHLHVVLRLDGVDTEDRRRVAAPPAGITASVVSTAVQAAVARVAFGIPAPDGVARVAQWGDQVDVQDITSGDSDSAVPVASYLAKYTTKHVHDSPGLAQRLDAAPGAWLVRAVGWHLARLVRTAWMLGGLRDLAGLRLRRWAHALGHRGHVTTRSRGWGVTLSALRATRRAWRARQAGDAWASGTVVGAWRYVGLGYRTGGDAALAAGIAEELRVGRAEVRAQRRHEREIMEFAIPV